MRIYLIRHGATAGNAEGRYIGRTDEPLSEEGRALISAAGWPKVDAVVVSPMLRCVQSARIMFPGREYMVVRDLRECDFGIFEGLNYRELDGREDYQNWIDSGGRLPFPNGEDRAGFSERCTAAFERVVRSLEVGSAAFVVHGGTIMAILERFGRPRMDYYDYQISNGHGYSGDFRDGEIVNISAMFGEGDGLQ